MYVPSRAVTPNHGMTTNATAALSTTDNAAIHGRGLAVLTGAIMANSHRPSQTSLTHVAKLGHSAVAELMRRLVDYNVVQRLGSRDAKSNHPTIPLTPTLRACTTVNMSVSANSIRTSTISLSNRVLTRRCRRLGASGTRGALAIIHHVVSSLHVETASTRLAAINVAMTLRKLVTAGRACLLDDPGLN